MQVRFALAAGAAALAMTVGGSAAQAKPRAQASSYLGTPVSTKDVPWVVALTAWGIGLKKEPFYGKQGYGLGCSATVIGPQRVLTAAHCIDDYDLKRLAVSVGIDDVGKDAGRVVPIARVWAPYKAERLRFGHDIALIETKEPLGVTPIALASGRPQPGETVSSYGYGGGTRVGDDGKSAGRLARLDAVVQPDCAAAGDANAICTKAPNGGGVRSGDSGGPLVVVRDGTPFVVGPASAGDLAGTTNVFTDATTEKAFLAAPPDAALFPVLQQPDVTISGKVRPGGKVTCVATFAPAPKRIEFRWRIGSLQGARKFFRDAKGKKVYYRSIRPAFSHKRSITIPRDAGGKPLACSVNAYTGPYHRINGASDEQRIPQARTR